MLRAKAVYQPLLTIQYLKCYEKLHGYRPDSVCFPLLFPVKTKAPGFTPRAKKVVAGTGREAAISLAFSRLIAFIHIDLPPVYPHIYMFQHGFSR